MNSSSWGALGPTRLSAMWLVLTHKLFSVWFLTCSGCDFLSILVTEATNMCALIQPYWVECSSLSLSISQERDTATWRKCSYLHFHHCVFAQISQTIIWCHWIYLTFELSWCLRGFVLGLYHSNLCTHIGNSNYFALAVKVSPSIPGINCGDGGVKTTAHWLQPSGILLLSHCGFLFLVQPNVIYFALVQTHTFKSHI